MKGLFSQILPHGQPETIEALARQGMEVSEIADQLGLDPGIVLNVLKGDKLAESEEVTTKEAAEIKAALLSEFRATDDPYLRTKIGLELYKERPSARRIKQAQADAAAVNFQQIQAILVAADQQLLTFSERIVNNPSGGPEADRGASEKPDNGECTTLPANGEATTLP